MIFFSSFLIGVKFLRNDTRFYFGSYGSLSPRALWVHSCQYLWVEKRKQGRERVTQLRDFSWREGTRSLAPTPTCWLCFQPHLQTVLPHEAVSYEMSRTVVSLPFVLSTHTGGSGDDRMSGRKATAMTTTIIVQQRLVTLVLDCNPAHVTLLLVLY